MIQLINESAQKENFQAICDKWQLTHQSEIPLALVLTDKRLELRKLDEPKLGAIAVDFVEGVIAVSLVADEERQLPKQWELKEMIFRRSLTQRQVLGVMLLY